MMFKKTMPYAVELEGALWFHQKGRLRSLANLSQLKGDCRLVTDFQNALARTMTVEADTRYVELMISRKLQEDGEFDEPVTIITHWKKKRGKSTFDILFTAVPAKRYFEYQELVADHPDHLVVLPLQSVLFAMLKKYGKKLPVAVVFQHGRFADVLVGTGNKIWYANRVVAFDHSQEQTTALWETIRSDIEAAAATRHQDIDKVYVATWVDSGPLPQWSGPGQGLEIIALDEEAMEQDDEIVQASLPQMLYQTPARLAVASAKDKVINGARAVLPVLSILLLIGALITGGLGLWHQVQAAGLQEQIRIDSQKIQAMHPKVPRSFEQVPYESVLDFIERLWFCRQLPTYSHILADLGLAIDGVLRVENIKADYTENHVTITAFGTSLAPFEVSHKAYQALRKRLSKKGYRVADERFDTQINTSHFVLQFVKEVQ
jgi:hypothetical protein